MRLCVTPEGAWALLDESAPVLRHVAGGLDAWAPRLANGEGRHALPVTGRIEPHQPRALHARAVFRRLFNTREVAPAPHWSLAAVVGASLRGRRNPLRSVVGYVGVTRVGEDLVFGDALVTRDEFGDAPLALRGPHQGELDVLEHLRALEAQTGGLRTGDVIVLGEPAQPHPVLRRLIPPVERSGAS